MATIEGTTMPNDKTVGEVGDVYVNTISGMSYELIYIGTITYKEGVRKIYDWRPIQKDPDKEAIEKYKIDDIISLCYITPTNNRTLTITDEIGTVTVKEPYIIFPNFTINGSVFFNSLPNVYHGTLLVNNFKYVDYSKINVSDNCYITFRELMFNNKFIDTFVIANGSTFMSSAIKYTLDDINKNNFNRGIIFPERVRISSTWINGPTETNELQNDKRFIVPKNFIGNLYLQKFLLTVTNIVNIFENLADLTDTGTSYTFHLGSTNLEKLTDEQIAIAEQKGWILQ